MSLADLAFMLPNLFDLTSFRAFTIRIGRDLDGFPNVHAGFRDRLVIYLDAARAQGWLPGLLNEIEIERPLDAALREVLAKLRDEIGETHDGWFHQPTEAQLAPVVERMGVADRDQLRRYLRDMSEQGRKRLLVLRGNASSGKSFSKHLIAYVALRQGHACALVDLGYWGEATAPLVADAILDKLQLARVAGSDHSTLDRLVEDLARGVGDRIRGAGRRTWLFLDHLDTAPIHPGVPKLIQKLAFLAQEEDYDLRIVVAVRARSRTEVFGVPGQRSLEEEVVQVGDADLERYFETVATQTGKTVESAKARARVRELAGADPYDLAPALWLVVTELFGPGVGL